MREREQVPANHTLTSALVAASTSATDALDFLKRAPGTRSESEWLDDFDPFPPVSTIQDCDSRYHIIGTNVNTKFHDEDALLETDDRDGGSLVSP
jgi:hypothetical protein